MSKNDLFDDMSIDSILNDVKRITGQESASERIWSLDEIDALLSDDEPIEAKSETVSVPEEPKAPKSRISPSRLSRKKNLTRKKNRLNPKGKRRTVGSRT